jgi:hypothetical protein
MKARALSIFDFTAVLLCVLVLLVVSACGDRHHTLKQSTAYIGGDGKTNKVVNVDFSSGIRIAGQKLEMKDLQLTESVGKDGWNYGVGVSEVAATPDSVIANFLSDLAPAAVQAFAAYQGNSNPTALPDELQAKMEELDSRLEDIARIAKALEGSE